MKTLYLLRHAKSSRDDPSLDDFDRPLNARGIRDAAAVAAYMVRAGMVPAAILCSAARRTVETWEHMAPVFEGVEPARTEFDLYMAPSDVLLRAVQRLEDDASSALVIAHNPGIEELAGLLAGDGEKGPLRDMRKKYPTTALAVLTFTADSWADIGEGDGFLTAFVRPKALPG